jgi:hypothetical protein
MPSIDGGGAMVIWKGGLGIWEGGLGIWEGGLGIWEGVAAGTLPDNPRLGSTPRGQ